MECNGGKEEERGIWSRRKGRKQWRQKVASWETIVEGKSQEEKYSEKHEDVVIHCLAK